MSLLASRQFDVLKPSGRRVVLQTLTPTLSWSGRGRQKGSGGGTRISCLGEFGIGLLTTPRAKNFNLAPSFSAPLPHQGEGWGEGIPIPASTTLSHPPPPADNPPYRMQRPPLPRQYLRAPIRPGSLGASGLFRSHHLGQPDPDPDLRSGLSLPHPLFDSRTGRQKGPRLRTRNRWAWKWRGPWVPR